jgi:ketosteroid isomerase-like protein
MSRENVEAVLPAFHLLEANDFEQWAALWHPEARATAPTGWPEPGPFVGRDAIVRQFERITADWQEHHFEDIELVADSGDWVVFTYRWHARGRTSGINTRFDLAVASRVQDGRTIEAHFRWNRDEALEAAGVSE